MQTRCGCLLAGVVRGPETNQPRRVAIISPQAGVSVPEAARSLYCVCRPCMPLLCAMGRGREEEEEERQRATAVPRRGRWFDGEKRPSTPAAGRAGWRCRSCAAVAIADCVALGCCPCAVVTLLGLVLVRAPLAVGRRLRRNRRSPLRRKRVRDVAASSAGKTTARDKVAGAARGAGGGTMLDPADDHATVGAEAALVQQQQMQAEAEEPAWLDEMYRVGHWGFGRVSFSASAGKTP